MTTHDMGDLTMGIGIATNRDGTFKALTLTQSKDFKTRAGAVRWLAARGYAENGTAL